MLDWIIPTLVVVSLILLLTEVWVRLFFWKRKKPHIYEQLAKTVADDTHEDEEVSAAKTHIEKLEKMNRDK